MAELSIEIEKVVKDADLDAEVMMKKVDGIQDRIKFISFGKTKVKKTVQKVIMDSNSEKKTTEAVDIIKKQSERIEKEVEAIRQMKQGRCTQVFKMKEIIAGPKKAGQEAAAVKDPKTGKMVVNNGDIKKTCLKYSLDVLKKNEPSELFKDQMKFKEDLINQLVNDTEGHYEVEEESYWELLDRLKTKNKRSYDFIVKSGDKFKKAILKLVKRVINMEEIPEKFLETLLVQLYKGKGCQQELPNSRFLHIMDWLPRVCESLAVSGMREDILKAGSIYQLGGKPGMRTQFHIFTVKSLIAMKLYKKEGIVLSIADIRKFFDKESLVDTCVTLHQANVDTKCLRVWWKLNERCRLSVLTGVGRTEEGETGPLVGQGGVGASLASQLNLDMGINKYLIPVDILIPVLISRLDFQKS